MILIIVGVVLFVILLFFIITYNRLNRASIKVDEAFSGIDVALAKRYDLLTQMVNVVKGYMKHEKDVLVDVVKIRSGMSLDEKVKANESMDKSFNKVNILVEKYPEIKANENFLVLQKSIIDVEEHLQAARRLYNSNVSIFNQMLLVFPTNLIGKMIKMKKKEFFKAEETDVHVDLN